jgi:hypothetical protein
MLFGIEKAFQVEFDLCKPNHNVYFTNLKKINSDEAA